MALYESERVNKANQGPSYTINKKCKRKPSRNNALMLSGDSIVTQKWQENC